jgi:hypothetical protein
LLPPAEVAENSVTSPRFTSPQRKWPARVIARKLPFPAACMAVNLD